MIKKNDNGRYVLDKNTLVPIGTLIAIVIGTWTVASFINGMRYELKALNDNLEMHNEVFRDHIDNDWMRDDMWRWESGLREDNPELNVPRTRHYRGVESR